MKRIQVNVLAPVAEMTRGEMQQVSGGDFHVPFTRCKFRNLHFGFTNVIPVKLPFLGCRFAPTVPKFLLHNW